MNLDFCSFNALIHVTDDSFDFVLYIQYTTQTNSTVFDTIPSVDVNLRLSFYRNVDPGLGHPAIHFFLLIATRIPRSLRHGKFLCGEIHGRTICIRGRIRLHDRRRSRSPDIRRDTAGA